jgi:hypothetical protein
MPASQAGRHGFDPRRPLHKSSEQLITSERRFFGFLADKAKVPKTFPSQKQ